MEDYHIVKCKKCRVTHDSPYYFLHCPICGTWLYDEYHEVKAIKRERKVI